jgi:hypothetical protein
MVAKVLVGDGEIGVCLILFPADVSEQDQMGADIPLDEPDQQAHAVHSQSIGNHERLLNGEREGILTGHRFGTYKRRLRLHERTPRRF